MAFLTRSSLRPDVFPLGGARRRPEHSLQEPLHGAVVVPRLTEGDCESVFLYVDQSRFSVS
jgi:hypothetical protein